MHHPWRAPARALVAPFALILLLIAVAPASGAIVLNEVESNASDGAPDWVEVKNDGAAAVDISGYKIRDNQDGNVFTVPGGTIVPANGYYVAEGLGFGLGASDSARISDAGDSPLDNGEFTWGSESPTTYGRCPDGTGAFVQTSSPTPVRSNNCTAPVAGLAWPGGSAVSIVDGDNVFGPNLSGLTYQPSGTAAPGVLWAVRNSPSTLFRLIFDGTKWTPDTANSWSAGKQLFYPDGSGVPDAEGVTLAASDASGIYVSTERNDIDPFKDTSRPAVLRFQTTDVGATLSATRDWNMTSDFPATPDNKGLEAVTWVPDSLLVDKGFVDANSGAAYDPAAYANHGGGLFFVGVELSGRIVAYALSSESDTPTRVAEFESGFPSVMGLEYEPESTHLWAACDDTCNGQTKILDIAQSGASDGRFVVTKTFERPADAPNLNNEGFAIAPQQECKDGLKPVFYSDDTNTGGHALRAGTLNCTVIPPDKVDDPVKDPVKDPVVTPPVTTNPGPVTPVRPPIVVLADRAAPTLSILLRLTRATRRTGKLGLVVTLGERANLTITATARRSARRKARSILRATRSGVAAGKRTLPLTLSRRVRRALRRGETVTFTVVARDAAGNATTRRTTAKVR